MQYFPDKQGSWRPSPDTKPEGPATHLLISPLYFSVEQLPGEVQPKPQPRPHMQRAHTCNAPTHATRPHMQPTAPTTHGEHTGAVVRCKKATKRLRSGGTISHCHTPTSTATDTVPHPQPSPPPTLTRTQPAPLPTSHTSPPAVTNSQERAQPKPAPPGSSYCKRGFGRTLGL